MSNPAKFLLGGVKSPIYENFEAEEGEDSYTPSERRKLNQRHGLKWKRAFFGLLGGYFFTLGLMFYIWPTVEEEVQSSPEQVVFPDIPSRPVTFNNMANFYPPPNNLSLSQNQLFAALQPKGKGFISITNPSQYGLSGGIPSQSHPEEEGYCISMFHQLHCLDGLRALLESDNPSLMLGDDGHRHVGHCVDYLRQGIMCAGDMTLEKSVVVDGVRIAATNGWGEVHQCKDFGRIWELAEERGFVADS